jgi:autophagy-related protein 18
MLNSTNLILLVGEVEFGDFSPRKATMWSTIENSIICSSWPFPDNIFLTKLNRKRIIICERNYLHIYTTEDMKHLHSLDIGSISPGKLFLSPTSDKNNYVCYSNSNDEGIVQVYDLLCLSLKNSVKAHKSAVHRIVMNIKGNLLGTCSMKGTIFRVFSIPKGDKLFTYKRGMSSAIIYSMNFSSDSEKLITSSNTGTIHVFDLKEEVE